MKCFTVRRLLHDVVDDVPNEATRAARQHMQDCADCRAEYAELATAQRQLASLAPGATPDALVASTMAAIAAAGAPEAEADAASLDAEPAPPRLRLVASHAAAALLGAAAMLVLWLGGWVTWGEPARDDGRPRPGPTSVRAVPVVDRTLDPLPTGTGPESVPGDRSLPPGAPERVAVTHEPPEPAPAPMEAHAPWLAVTIDGDAVGSSLDRLTLALQQFPRRVMRAAQVAQSRPTWKPAPPVAVDGVSPSMQDAPRLPTRPEGVAASPAHADVARATERAASAVVAPPPEVPELEGRQAARALAASIDVAPTTPSVIFEESADGADVRIVIRSRSTQDIIEEIVPRLIGHLDHPDVRYAREAENQLEIYRAQLGGAFPVEEELAAGGGWLTWLRPGKAKQTRRLSPVESWRAWHRSVGGFLSTT